MLKLNLPEYEPRLKRSEGKLWIFDPLRKKFLVLNPEEWVRQHYLNFLTVRKNVPASLIRQEFPVTYNGIKKRADILVFNRNAKPVLMVECKASMEKIDEKVFFQILTYSSKVNVPYLALTNGITHLYSRWDEEKNTYGQITDLPDFVEMDN